jgi:Tol biopolymer transport system component
MNGEETRILWQPTSQGFYRLPEVSPDGETLSYALCSDSFACHIFVVGLSGSLAIVGAPRRLTRLGEIPTGIAWTPDGRAVIFGFQREYISFLWRAAV